MYDETCLFLGHTNSGCNEEVARCKQGFGLHNEMADFDVKDVKASFSNKS